MKGEINEELEEDLKLAELILDRLLTNKEYIIKVFGEDEFNRRLYFNRGKVEILKDKFVIVNKKIGDEIINEKLEDELNELFPKNKNSNIILVRKFRGIAHTFAIGDLEESDYNIELLNLIEDIQKESGRDRALVLFALAQNKINELEKKIKELEEEIKGDNQYIMELQCIGYGR